MTETAEKILTPQEVKSYLLDNPDFLLDHQDLFTKLNFPHETSGATSLIERQVQVLRESQKANQSQVSELTQTAAANHDLLKKMQTLTLELITAQDGNLLVTALDNLIRQEFGLDAMQLLLPQELEDTNLPLSQFLPAESLQQMRSDIFNLDIYVGRIPAKLSEYFSPESLQNITSIALLKLDIGSASYLLLGSSEETRFQSDMATDFIQFIASVLSILLNRHLERK